MNEKTELSDEEREEAMAHDALIYNLSVVLMRLDGNDGDPHQLLWTGGTIPEPWGDAWQRYEDQALAVLNAIGEGSALAMVERLAASPSSKSTKEAERLTALLERLRERCAETAEGISSDYPESARDTAEAIRAIELDVAVRQYLASSSIKEDGERAEPQGEKP